MMIVWMKHLHYPNSQCAVLESSESNSGCFVYNRRLLYCQWVTSNDKHARRRRRRMAANEKFGYREKEREAALLIPCKPI